MLSPYKKERPAKGYFMEENLLKNILMDTMFD